MNSTADWLENLYNKHLKQLQAYQSIEPPAVVAKRLGLRLEELIKIDANESPYGFPPQASQALAGTQFLHYYPDPNQKNLKTLIAGYTGVDASQIVAGAGADELIDLLCRLFLSTADTALICPPTFGFYKHAISLSGAKLKCLNCKADFSISINQLSKLNWQNIKMVFLCSPNNPTGQLLEPAVLEFCLQQKVIVVVDEAYFEFSDHSFIPLLAKYPQLIILRTFSKLFAMAGLRLGYGLMHPQIASMLMKIKPPYNTNVAAEVAVEECLKRLPEFKAQAVQIKQVRDNILQVWGKIPNIAVFPSKANFFLVRFEQADALFIQQQLAKKGILVRSYTTLELKNCLRFSISTEQKMQTCHTALLDILNNL